MGLSGGAHKSANTDLRLALLYFLSESMTAEMQVHWLDDQVRQTIGRNGVPVSVLSFSSCCSETGKFYRILGRMSELGHYVSVSLEMPLVPSDRCV